MKQLPQTHAPVAILRAAVEAWRTASRMSREAVAIVIVEAHEANGADAATEILFDFGGDAFDRARRSAQKIFRWLDEGNLPANMIPSVLAALPMEARLQCLGQMFCPMGIEVRQVGSNGGDVDISAHLPRVMKEASEAQLSLVTLPADASDAQLLGAHKELTEAAQACESAAHDVMAKVVARQTVARAASPAST